MILEAVDDNQNAYPLSINSDKYLRITIADSLPAGTNNIGDVDIASMPSIPAGDNNIGNVDIETLPSNVIAGMNTLPPGTNIIGAVKIDTINYTTIHKSGDYSTAQTDTNLWTPTSGKKFVITDIIISTDTSMTVTLKDDTTTIRKYYLQANTTIVENLHTPYTSIAADNILKITSSAAGNHYISIQGYEV